MQRQQLQQALSFQSLRFLSSLEEVSNPGLSYGLCELATPVFHAPAASCLRSTSASPLLHTLHRLAHASVPAVCISCTHATASWRDPVLLHAGEAGAAPTSKQDHAVVTPRLRSMALPGRR